MLLRTFALFALFWSGIAAAAPFQARHAERVRVRVAGQMREGFGVRARAGVWRLDVGLAAARASAEIIDVTPRTAARTLVVAVIGGELLFDPSRFTGGHVYRVQLRSAGSPLESAFVYLYPDVDLKVAPRPRGAKKVTFTADEPRPSEGSLPSTLSKTGL